ncbi:MAG: hypothetical protein ABFQ64_00145 [Campylobacterota bacterium]
MKYANYIILFVIVTFALIFKEQIHISTNLLSLFASKESVEKLNIASELGYTKEMMIAVKGFDNSSKKVIDELSEKLKNIKGIELVESKIIPSSGIQEYYKKYYTVLADFNDTKQSRDEINAKLQVLYDYQMESFFYTPINKNDPLKLFSLKSKKKSNITSRGDYMTLGDYGYLIRVKTDVAPSQMSEAKRLYKDVKKLTALYSNVIVFAGFFYTVENSTKIKEDVTLIVTLSTILLIVMYVLLIRNIRLLSNAVVTLLASMLFALLGSVLVYENFHVMSLVFGMSVTAVSIDYLFHYYFHNFYQNRDRIDKSVLYGYLTTTVAFAIFSFIPVPLIAQISFFTAMSLSFAYFVFTFVFPYLNLGVYKENVKKEFTFNKVPVYIFLSVSIMLLIYTSINIEFDNNIRNLDYQNKKLQELEKLFKSSAKLKYTPVVVEGKNEDELIANLHLLHKDDSKTYSLASFVPNKKECQNKKEILKRYDFERLSRIVNEEAEKIGFKSGYFKTSYDFISKLPPCDKIDLDVFKGYSLSSISKDNIYYAMAFVKDIKTTSRFDFVTPIDVKEMFKKVSDKMFADVFVYSIVVISVIVLLIAFSVKKRFFFALNFILFPVSLVLAFLATFYEINIMHIFSLIILIAIGIDYGIYMSNSNRLTTTMLAIKYSLFSTFAAFGVLVFSSITALNSIGLVISLGIGAIFVLIKVMR